MFNLTYTQITSNKSKAFSQNSTISQQARVFLGICMNYVWKLQRTPSSSALHHQDLMHSHLIFWKHKTTDYIFMQVELRFPSL